jgi:hypothetical protein
VFDDPIPLPDGRRLATLEYAGRYITQLPKAEHEAAEWQAAMEVDPGGNVGGPTMFARIGVMRALNRNVERVFNPDRKDHLWGRRKLARDSWEKNETPAWWPGASCSILARLITSFCARRSFYLQE